MKEAFITKKLHAESLAMVDTINAILDNYEAQGYDLSLRQLYYQLVSRNIVPNTAHRTQGCPRSYSFFPPIRLLVIDKSGNLQQPKSPFTVVRNDE